MRRRVAFATPFVVVVGCSKPAPEPVEPRITPPAPPRSDAGVVDAAMPIDAAIATTSVSISPVDQWRPPEACNERPPHSCNPPRPGCGRPDLSCMPVTARIIAAKVDGDHLVVTAAASTEEKVTADWLACVQRAGTERCVPGGDLDVIEIKGAKITATLKATDIDLDKNRMVRLVPPHGTVATSEKARIIAVAAVGPDTIATIGAGSAKGVTNDSKICVLDARDTAGTKCLPGGELEVLEVKANVTKARTRLTMEQLKTNPRVLIR